MLGFLRDLKDPWKLLVMALVAANIIAMVAVFMMMQKKSDAKKARTEATEMLRMPTQDDKKNQATIFEELRDYNKIHMITQKANLDSTSQHDVENFIHKWANELALPNRNIKYGEQKSRQKGFTDHTWRVTFDKESSYISRNKLAYFLFQIKTHLPQLKIDRIRSGNSSKKTEDADKWFPEVVFILTKENIESSS